MTLIQAYLHARQSLKNVQAGLRGCCCLLLCLMPFPDCCQAPGPDLWEYWLVVQRSRNTFFFVYEGILLLSLPPSLSLLFHQQSKAMCERKGEQKESRGSKYDGTSKSIGSKDRWRRRRKERGGKGGRGDCEKKWTEVGKCLESEGGGVRTGGKMERVDFVFPSGCCQLYK